MNDDLFQALPSLAIVVPSTVILIPILILNTNTNTDTNTHRFLIHGWRAWEKSSFELVRDNVFMIPYGWNINGMSAGRLPRNSLRYLFLKNLYSKNPKY